MCQRFPGAFSERLNPLVIQHNTSHHRAKGSGGDCVLRSRLGAVVGVGGRMQKGKNEDAAQQPKHIGPTRVLAHGGQAEAPVARSDGFSWRSRPPVGVFGCYLFLIERGSRSSGTVVLSFECPEGVSMKSAHAQSHVCFGQVQSVRLLDLTSLHFPRPTLRYTSSE